MTRRSPPFTLDELPGSRYSDLADAQRAALVPTSADLASTFRRLLASGVLVMREGKVIPNPDRL